MKTNSSQSVPAMQSFNAFLWLAWTNFGTNGYAAGDLRRHVASLWGKMMILRQASQMINLA